MVTQVKSFVVWGLKLCCAKFYLYKSAGSIWAALLAAELLEGALTGTWAFMGHRWAKDRVARSIGWPTGHRFQNEISWMNAGIAVSMAHGLVVGMFGGPEPRFDAVAAAVLTHGTIYLGCAETHFVAIHEDGNWCVNNAGFFLLLVDDIGAVLFKASLLLLASDGGARLEPLQYYGTLAVLAAALWFTYRYFAEVHPHRDRVHAPKEPQE